MSVAALMGFLKILWVLLLTGTNPTLVSARQTGTLLTLPSASSLAQVHLLLPGL